jgi:hypothetical protein
LQGDLTALAMTSEMQAPPASAKQRLLQQIGREKKVVPLATAAAGTERDAFSERPERQDGREREPGQRGAAEDPRRSGVRSVREIREVPAVRDPAVRDSDVRDPAVRDSDVRDPAVRDSDVRDLDEAEAERAARRGSRGGRGGRVLPCLGWAVAAGALLTAGDLYHQRAEMRASLIAASVKVANLSVQAERGQAVLDALTDQSATRVTLTETPEVPEPVGRATYVPDKGALLFTASNLAPLDPYKTYELWLIPADGHDPIPAGTFQPDERGNASVILPQLPKGVIAKAFGVTVEDAGGSQQPTLPILLVGTPT